MKPNDCVKGYMKEVKSKLPADRVPIFEKNAAAFAKKIVANFKDFEFVSLLIIALTTGL